MQLLMRRTHSAVHLMQHEFGAQLLERMYMRECGSQLKEIKKSNVIERIEDHESHGHND